MRRPRARKLAALVGAAVIMLALGAGPVSAVPGFGDRPGNGGGDVNHDHEDGPPGQDLESENERPGYGGGDVNHGHEDGPPGQDLPDDD